jgi:predicted peroxiredoxin
MKNFGLLILTLLLFTSCNQNNGKSSSTRNANTSVSSVDTVRDGVFIHITESYNDPHRVLMPLKMGNMMAKDKDVLVYLDIHAVELVTKSSKDMQFADFDPLKKLLQDLIDKKVGIYVCPTCMKIANIKPEALIEGVQLAQKDKFFNFTKGRIITLDY